MITIPNNLPSPPARPLDLVQAGKTAARILRARAQTNTLGQGDFEHFMGRIEKGFEAAVAMAEAQAAEAPKPVRQPRNEPFSVIEGGRP